MYSFSKAHFQRLTNILLCAFGRKHYLLFMDCALEFLFNVVGCLSFSDEFTKLHRIIGTDQYRKKDWKYRINYSKRATRSSISTGYHSFSRCYCFGGFDARHKISEFNTGTRTFKKKRKESWRWNSINWPAVSKANETQEYLLQYVTPVLRSRHPTESIVAKTQQIQSLFQRIRKSMRWALYRRPNHCRALHYSGCDAAAVWQIT